MGLRTKLAGAFVVLLMGAVLAAGFVDISWTLAKMADEVVDSGNVVAAEGFEQVRTVLAHTHGNPVYGLRTDPNLTACIQSVRAFATGIVFIDITGANAEPIAGERQRTSVFSTAPSIDARVATP